MPSPRLPCPLASRGRGALKQTEIPESTGGRSGQSGGRSRQEGGGSANHRLVRSKDACWDPGSLSRGATVGTPILLKLWREPAATRRRRETQWRSFPGWACTVLRGKSQFLPNQKDRGGVKWSPSQATPETGPDLLRVTFSQFGSFVKSQSTRGGKTLEGPSSFQLRLQSPHPISCAVLAPKVS